MLKQFSIVSYPTLKKEDRNRLHKRIHKAAYPEIHEKQKPLTMEDAVKALGGLGGR